MQKSLTPREIEQIRDLRASGKTYKEIRQLSGHGDQTIRTYAWDVDVPLCACGRPKHHRGWCANRQQVAPGHFQYRHTSIWSEAALDALRTEWERGTTKEDLVDVLEKIIGWRFNPNTIAKKASDIRAARSPEGMKLSRQRGAAALLARRAKEAFTGANQPLQPRSKSLSPPPPIPPLPVERIPYMSLGLKGPDPFRGVRLQQVRDGGRGRV
jgi:hypothetical protein